MNTDTNEGPIETFWRLARRHAGLETVPGYFGQGPLEALAPPAWSFGAAPEIADELLELVLSGTKTATASAYADYEAEGEAVPVPGELSIVLDSHGSPRALLATTEVRVCAFDEVDAEHAYLEGEGDRSLESWRRVHEGVFAEHAHGGFSPQMSVVLERFELRYASR